VQEAVFAPRNIRGQKKPPIARRNLTPTLRVSPSPFTERGLRVSEGGEVNAVARSRTINHYEVEGRLSRAEPKASLSRRDPYGMGKASLWDFGGSPELGGINRINWMGINPVYPVILSKFFLGVLGGFLRSSCQLLPGYTCDTPVWPPDKPGKLLLLRAFLRRGWAADDWRAYRNTPLHFLSLLIFVRLCSPRPQRSLR